MALSGEAKREYNKLRQRRLRLVAREREYEGEGGQQKGQHVKRKVVPDTTQIGGGTTHSQSLNYSRLQKDLRGAPNPFASKSAQRALSYMAYINARGYTVDVETGEMLDLRLGYEARIEHLEAELLLTQQALAALQLDISLQRANAVLDAQWREAQEMLEEEP